MPNTSNKTTIGSTQPRFVSLSDEEDTDHLHEAAADIRPKLPPIFASDVTTILPLLQLLYQIVKQQYEIKALPDNQVRIQPKTPDSYRVIIKVLAEKNTPFHIYKPKDEQNYRVMLKNMHYSINPADIQSEVEKLGHTVANIFTIKHHSTKLPLSMFFFDFKPASNNNIFSSARLRLSPPPKKKGEILFNALTASDMAIQKITVTSNPGVSHVQRHTQQSTASARKELTMSAVSSVEATTLSTTRVAWYKRNFKRRPIHHSTQKFSLPPPPQHIQTSNIQRVTYALSTKPKSFAFLSNWG
jgi:hypothetical protein